MPQNKHKSRLIFLLFQEKVYFCKGINLEKVEKSMFDNLEKVEIWRYNNLEKVKYEKKNI